jgi:hypothetical protein
MISIEAWENHITEWEPNPGSSSRSQNGTIIAMWILDDLMSNMVETTWLLLIKVYH